jgi:hypothetical protein
MVATNLPFATLVFRYGEDALPPADDLWNFFLFSNERFQELAGIESTKIGLSQPPGGKLGQRLTWSVRNQWPNMAEGAVKFLQHCDEQYRKSKKSNKGVPPTFESFQKLVLNRAPHSSAWIWIVNHFFDVPGGLYQQLRELMKDHRCDAEEAYRCAREDMVCWVFLLFGGYETYDTHEDGEDGCELQGGSCDGNDKV